MTGIVLELQAEALQAESSVTLLVRKALVVSRKLDVEEIQQWLTCELNGYDGEHEVPVYRHVHGQIKVFNPYHGWQPLRFGDIEIGERLSQRQIRQPIGEIETLSNTGESFQAPFSESIRNRLMRAMEAPLEPTLHLPPTAVTGILDAVRNNILEWTLELEKNAVIGEGLTFSNNEREAAQNATYQITNNIGSISGSQFQQASHGSNQVVTINEDPETVVELLEQILASLETFELEPAEEQQLKAHVESALVQSKSPNPSKTIIGEALRSMRTILEAATGNAVATGFVASISRLLSG